MDNPTFQSDYVPTKQPPKKPLTRTLSTLTPTTKSWHLTQMPRSKLCRCNSVLVSKNCCEETQNNLDGPASLDYPFFAKKSSTKNILSENTLWTKEFWSDSYNRLHSSSPVFQKFPESKSEVATIYDPQFLCSKFGYVGSHHPIGNQEKRKEWWPGGWPWTQNQSTNHRVAALFCALVLILLATVNVVYILKSVAKPIENVNKVTWIDVVLINGEFRILNEPYLPTFSNHTSDDFEHLSSIITHKLDSLFSLSVISEPYHSTAVSDLLPGLLVRCQIVLRANSQVSASKVGLAFIGGLRNQHGHVWLGNFSVDIQSIGFQGSADAVAWTDWSDWGGCQQTQEFGFVQIRTRNCTLRSGQYLHSTLPCLLVPHSHSNIETAPCTPSQDHLAMAESDIDLVEVIVNTTEQYQKIVKSPIQITRANCSKNKSDEVISHQNLTTTDETTNLPIKNGSELCSCADNQVCVALQEDVTPQCLPVLDANDPTGCGGHCKLNTQLCQRIRDNAFRCIDDDSKCMEDEWQCGNQLCIPLSKRCDGHFNCYDHTDEFNCDCVGAEQFTCNDSQCIPNHKFCDGYPDCKDHSDEPFGCSGDCKTHEWRCRNSRCIPQRKRCNGVDDCGDNSDENKCQSLLPV